MYRVTDRYGQMTAAKVHDAGTLDRAELAQRVDVQARLAAIHPVVCRPLTLEGRYVTDAVLDGHSPSHIVRFEWIDGLEPDVTEAGAAAGMGTALAALHLALRELAPSVLPTIATAPTTPPSSRWKFTGSPQLLHGDFISANLLSSDGALRIVDFDDCGSGHIEFEVANALYSVMFDAEVAGDATTYRSFRRAFVSGYFDSARIEFAEGLIDELIDQRIETLRGWLAEPISAPIGIRNASTEWLDMLAGFVAGHQR